MENAWKELQPKNIYQGRKQSPLKEENRNALLYLYQPLIGGEALSVYLTLLTEISLETGQGPEGLHADLLSSLGCGIPQFYEARKKLEGIGLLDVYYKEDPSLGACFLYELLEPMSAKQFFMDSVLSFLLLEKVGERRFDQLVKRFEPKKLSTKGYQKKTKKFLEVYQFNEASFAADKQQIEKLEEIFTEQVATKRLPEKSTIDWAFLTNWLQKKHIDKPDEPTIKQLEMYQQLYGLDDLALGEKIVEAYDFTEQKVSLKELQKIFLANPVSQSLGIKVPVENSDSTEITNTKAESVPNQGQLSAASVQLIKEAQSVPPMKYLESIKKEKNGYVSKSETWLMQELVSRSGLPSSVINVLLNYVLVIKNQASLGTNYVNTIANEWAQQKVMTAEDAIAHIKKKSQEGTEKKQTRNYSNTRRNVRREKLPDWVNQPKDEKKISQEKQAEIDRRFKEYLAKKEGDN
ncbi:replication initiation and membrane attachment family protein [Candidatus Enterococcus courvalinii]|uniref:DnaD domain protein n=1 Tax=Candidatus Enterococcus courvalinii TaxID=2815329 RepID=A0ABS3HX24_9ENTE|nr:DnaD domain protein [Enterococcus sp. MSG2901]MBO0480951.1 DnaD domain protein [Enterococcus sp. MSG2901]